MWWLAGATAETLGLPDLSPRIGRGGQGMTVNPFARRTGVEMEDLPTINGHCSGETCDYL